MTHPRVYRALQAYGYSAATAAKIVTDAKRGHDGALLAIKLARGYK